MRNHAILDGTTVGEKRIVEVEQNHRDHLTLLKEILCRHDHTPTAAPATSTTHRSRVDMRAIVAPIPGLRRRLPQPSARHAPYSTLVPAQVRMSRSIAL